MPHLLFRGVDAEKLQAAAHPLVKQLAEACECGTDQFTLNVLHLSNVFGNGPDDPPYAFVEIGWFERGTETRDHVARLVTDAIVELGIADVEVVFHAYSESQYYINGSAVSK